MNKPFYFQDYFGEDSAIFEAENEAEEQDSEFSTPEVDTIAYNLKEKEDKLAFNVLLGKARQLERSRNRARLQLDENEVLLWKSQVSLYKSQEEIIKLKRSINQKQSFWSKLKQLFS